MKKDFSEKTTFYITISLFIGIFILPFISFFGVDVDELNLFRKTDVLVKNDWCYPSCDDDVQSSFKFSSDGTISSSQIFFGGSSRWGKWEKIDDNTFRLTTTRISTNSSNDQLPEPQTVRLISKKELQVGSTIYIGERLILNFKSLKSNDL